jgi:hypothetical protein
MGGDAVGDACEALEKAAERRDLAGVPAALHTLFSELDRLEAALRDRGRAAA